MKPSERIHQLYNKQPYPGYAGAIAQYLDEQYEKENALDGLKELEKQHNKNLKKPCLYCGTDYQDPKYCSVSGRTADKHVFDEGCAHGLGLMYPVKEDCHCQKELVSERNEEEGGYKWDLVKLKELGKACLKADKEALDVSERNALIDKKVFEILTGGIISIMDTTEGRKIIGFASASEVIAEYIESRENALIDEFVEDVRNWNPFFTGDHSKCPSPENCIGYQNAESDFDYEKENFINLLKSKKK